MLPLCNAGDQSETASPVHWLLEQRIETSTEQISRRGVEWIQHKGSINITFAVSSLLLALFLSLGYRASNVDAQGRSSEW